MISASGQSERAAFGSPVLAAVGAAVLAFAYGPLLWEFAGNLWSRPYYQHFPYVLLAAGILGFMQLRDADHIAFPLSPFPFAAVGLIASAWLVQALAIFALSPLLSAVSAILLVGGLLLLYCRHAGVRFPAGPWLLLWLLIPPPVGLDQRLLTRLQLTSSDLASKALDLLGVPHLMEGNALVLPTRQLFVDEACSGIVSVISLSACGAIYAVWRRRPLLHAALLMAAAVGWAVLMNVLRITVIALAEANAGVDLAEGAPHLLLGLGVFALNLLAVIAIDWLLHALLAEVDPPENLPAEPYLIRAWNYLAQNPSLQQGERLVHTNPPPRQGERVVPPTRVHKQALRPLTATLALTAFAAAALAQLALTPEFRLADLPAEKLPVEEIVAALLEPGVLPDQLGELTLVGVEHVQRESDDEFGEHSVIWEYRGLGGVTYSLSCDLAFKYYWHELPICYMGTGWNIDERRRVDLADKAESAVQFEISKSVDSRRLVSYCYCRGDGELVSPPDAKSDKDDKDIFRKVLAILKRRERELAVPRFYQLQVSTQIVGEGPRMQTQASQELLTFFYINLSSTVKPGLSPSD